MRLAAQLPPVRKAEGDLNWYWKSCATSTDKLFKNDTRSASLIHRSSQYAFLVMKHIRSLLETNCSAHPNICSCISHSIIRIPVTTPIHPVHLLLLLVLILFLCGPAAYSCTHHPNARFYSYSLHRYCPSTVA